MLRFLWIATRGYRLRSFFEFVWLERASLWNYLQWVRRMRKLERS